MALAPGNPLQPPSSPGQLHVTRPIIQAIQRSKPAAAPFKRQSSPLEYTPRGCSVGLTWLGAVPSLITSHHIPLHSSLRPQSRRSRNHGSCAEEKAAVWVGEEERGVLLAVLAEGQDLVLRVEESGIMTTKGERGGVSKATTLFYAVYSARILQGPMSCAGVPLWVALPHPEDENVSGGA